MDRLTRFGFKIFLYRKEYSVIEYSQRLLKNSNFIWKSSERPYPEISHSRQAYFCNVLLCVYLRASIGALIYKVRSLI